MLLLHLLLVPLGVLAQFNGLRAFTAAGRAANSLDPKSFTGIRRQLEMELEFTERWSNTENKYLSDKTERECKRVRAV
jgi:hypothetical protein